MFDKGLEQIVDDVDDVVGYKSFIFVMVQMGFCDWSVCYFVQFVMKILEEYDLESQICKEWEWWFL